MFIFNKYCINKFTTFTLIEFPKSLYLDLTDILSGNLKFSLKDISDFISSGVKNLNLFFNSDKFKIFYKINNLIKI